MNLSLKNFQKRFLYETLLRGRKNLHGESEISQRSHVTPVVDRRETEYRWICLVNEVQSETVDLIKRKNEKFSSQSIQLTVIHATSIIGRRDYKL